MQSIEVIAKVLMEITRNVLIGIVSKVIIELIKLPKWIFIAHKADITLECDGIGNGDNIIKVINSGKGEATDVRIMVTNMPKDEMYWDISPYETQNILNISHINPESQLQYKLLCRRIDNNNRIVAGVEIRWRDKRKKEQYKTISI